MANNQVANGSLFPRGFSTATRFPWPLVRAEELVVLNYGKALREGDRRPGGIRVYGTNGQCGWHDTRMQEGPGVILGRKGQGPLGVEWCDDDYWVIDTAYFITPKTDTLDLKYFYYLVKYIGLNHLKDGTSNPSLSRDTFNSLLLPFPPISAQQAIVRVLGTLDDKIELNRRMNETLEAMARAIFKSWFVDFDPVRAKAEGRDPGLPKPIADLFPNRFEDSELGRIPKGWKIVTLNTQVEAQKGLSYKGSGLAESGIPMHNLNSVYEGGGYKYEGIKFYAGEYEERHIVQAGDLIVTNTEQGHDCLLIGYAAVVPKCFASSGLFTHHLYRVRPFKDTYLTSQYLAFLFNSRAMHEEISGYGNGTTVNMLPADALQRPQIVIPPAPLVQAFDRLAVASFGRCEETVMQNHTLTRIRDALLPRLLSGELNVSQAGKSMKEVL